MKPKQQIFKIRRNYNQWVNNQTLEDYALRFTAIGSRKWSLKRVANTALGAISFLALEAIGGAITINYGFTNAFWAIAVVSVLIFLAGIPICYYAARYGVDIDLLTRGAGFGYIGSTATSLIYASFTFIFFALEAAIMAKAIELMTGLSLVWGYILSSIIVIPLVFHGITFISRFQLWTQPIWLCLQFLPLAVIAIYDFNVVKEWQHFPGVHRGSDAGFNILLFGAAASVMFALVAQIGEQVDFLRFLPPSSKENRTKWWLAMLAGGPGWIFIGALKLLVGSLLAFIALSHGADAANASDPTTMYTIAFSYLTNSPNAALILAGVFVIISQLKINVTNAYAGSIAWSNFFSRLTHSHPGRVVWLIFNVSIALLLMELGVYHAFEKTLSVYAIVAVAWVGTLVADLVINKPLGLSPKHIEFKRAYLHDINPVGVGTVVISSIIGVIAYLGVLGELLQAMAHFLTLAITLLLAPAIAYITRGEFYIARKDSNIYPSYQPVSCTICENTYEHQDMAFCPAYDGHICSLCCSLDSRCQDLCKSQSNITERFTTFLKKVVPRSIGNYINVRFIDFVTLFLFVAGVTGVLLALIYSNSITGISSTDELLESTLWKVFFILMIVAGVISWLFILAHESRIVAQEESQRQNKLLEEEIDAHQKTDLALQKAKEIAEAANNAKSRYLTGISHELRSPLNSILGYAQLLEGDPTLHPRRHHQVEVIRRSAEHLTDLIEGLLDISKIEAGRLEIQRHTFELDSLFDQLVDMFSLQAKEKGLDFTFEKKSKLPKFVTGDEKRVRQILINLLSNAVKFTQSGSVEFRISYRNEVASITVKDTGVGIPNDQVERIFKPFERIRLPGTPAVTGTGLGLTITRLLVDIMGGDLQLENNTDGGCTFKVWLMLAQEYRPQQSTEVARKIIGYEGKNISILIIDDDPTHRGLLNDLLTPLGFDVIEAADGEMCLDILNEFTPDLFIIDRMMPGIKGPELASKLRQRGFSQTIIMVSANAKEDTPKKDKRQDYDDYLIKPILLSSLLSLIEKHLNLVWRYQNSDKSTIKQVSKLRDELSKESLPSEDVLEELLGWAEVGSLTKVSQIIDKIDKEKLASKTVVLRLKNCLSKVDLGNIQTYIEGNKK